MTQELFIGIFAVIGAWSTAVRIGYTLAALGEAVRCYRRRTYPDVPWVGCACVGCRAIRAHRAVVSWLRGRSRSGRVDL